MTNILIGACLLVLCCIAFMLNKLLGLIAGEFVNVKGQLRALIELAGNVK